MWKKKKLCYLQLTTLLIKKAILLMKIKENSKANMIQHIIKE